MFAHENMAEFFAGTGTGTVYSVRLKPYTAYAKSYASAKTKLEKQI